MLKFEEMPYERPNLDKVKEELNIITKKLKDASTYDEAKEAFIEFDNAQRHLATSITISSIRYNINTKDEFYSEEDKFWNKVMPEIQAYSLNFTKELLNSKFRNEFEKE